jgi:4-hydroxythreonine-4-phosphate dehydrogenase
MIRVVFTCGDINGIGPEIAVKAFSKILLKKNKHLIFICPKNIFEFYYKQSKSNFKFKYLNENETFLPSVLNIIPLNDVELNLGKSTKQSGKTSYESIVKAISLIKNSLADVMVTAPISKESFKLAGINYPGHTELLASSEKKKDFLMLFLSEQINAALLTIHEPIKNVPSLITKEKISKAIKLLDETAKQDLGISSPKIAVLGLNPHAGENGLIGKEEEKIIKPIIKYFKNNFIVDGPFVPDAFWGSKIYKNYDAILGMYHDQILIPFKLLNFSCGVNFTAGLKTIRTSPDHGTAFDIAGKNKANISSLMQAYYYAIKIFKNRKYYSNDFKHC